MLLAATGCGGGQTKPKEADPASKPKDPGVQCIEQAEIEREAPIDAPERIDIAVILVRHAGVKNAGDAIVRSPEEACLRARKARKQLLSSGDWEAVHEKYSDAQGAMKGAMSNVSQGDLDPNVARAAFSLDVDQISHVVDSKRGFYVIWRQN